MFLVEKTEVVICCLRVISTLSPPDLPSGAKSATQGPVSLLRKPAGS